MACEELFHPVLDSAGIAADLLLQHQLEDLDRFLSLEEEEEEADDEDDRPQVSASTTVSDGSMSSSSRITGSPPVQPLGPPAEDDNKPIKRRKITSNSNGSRRSRGKKPKLEEPASAPVGFIHVRARRGEATDNHSLAERVRRGKISERMRVLQSLVPGCDKIKGKQLILDEIINYVQSLHNQIEFLSTKIASLSGVLDALGISSEDCMDQLIPEEPAVRMNMPQLMPSSVGEITPSFLPRSDFDDYKMMYGSSEPF